MFKISKRDSIVTHDYTKINFDIIDKNNDFNLHAILINDEEYISLNVDNYLPIKNSPKVEISKIEEITEYLINTYQSTVNKFILIIEYRESHLYIMIDNLIETDLRLKKIVDTFKKYNLFDRLVIRSNGIWNKKYSSIKHESIIYYLGKNMNSIFDLTKPRIFEYHFLSLIGELRKHRIHFHNFIQNDKNLKSKTLSSYNSFEDIFEKPNDMVWLDSNTTDKFKDMMIPGPYFNYTFCSLVYETFWDSPIFITEKVGKCFLAGHPFIMITAPKYLVELKKLGFKTFDRWWDESYDDEINKNLREKKIENLILEISSWSVEKCQQVYNEMLPTLIHNQDILKKIKNEYISDTYYLIPQKTTLL